MSNVLYTLAELLRRIALVLEPFAPQHAHAMLDQLSIPQKMRDMSTFSNKIVPGTIIAKPKPIFKKVLSISEAE